MLLGAKSAAVDWLVVGLGNPGAKYEHTRHNMGFLTVDLLAEQAGVKLNKVKFKSAYNIIPFAGAKCLVMKPQTYMNLSGEAVREAVSDEAAERIGGLKKPDMAAAAEALLAGTGWLPGLLRTAAPAEDRPQAEPIIEEAA